LQVAAPKTRPAPAKGDRQGSAPSLTHYYVELRTPTGFDSKLKPMVVIYLGPDLPTSSRSAPYVYLLDQTPATTSLTDSGLSAAGQSFQDPAGGLTITVDAIDTKSATVSITTMAGQGEATCVDGTTFATPGPDPTSCGGLSTVDAGSVGAGGGPGSEAGARDGTGGAAPEASTGAAGGGVSTAGTGGGGSVGEPVAPPAHEGSSPTSGTRAAGTSPDSGVEGGCACSMLRRSSATSPFVAGLLLAGALGKRIARRRFRASRARC
jgi:hypothetical protein